jgi:primase/DNA polymerase family protein
MKLPTEIVENQVGIDAVYAEIWPQKPSAKTTTNTSLTLDDDKLIKIASRARNGAEFLSLFRDGIDSGDPSQADYHLLCHLAFYSGRNATQMERLFNASPLANRDKWRDRADYRKRTIEKAIAATDAVFTGHAGGEDEADEVEEEATSESSNDSEATAKRTALLERLKRIAALNPLDREIQAKALAKELQVRVDKIRELLSLIDSGVDPFESKSEANPTPIVFDPTEERLKGARIIDHANPLELIRKAATKIGYAGETDFVEITYVVVTSRLLDHPVNSQLLGPSSTGKNYTIETTLQFLPPEAFHTLSASSPRALIYTDENFEHRTIVLGEGDSIPEDGPAASAVRSIVTDGHMSYEVVEKNPATGKMEVRRIIKQGPTNLITTGVKSLGIQMGTRTLTQNLPDDANQTRAVLQAEGRMAAGETPASLSESERDEFWSFQRWLRCETKGCVVPFAKVLADLVPAEAVRMRRDFRQLITIIMTIAVLNQQRRRKTSDGFVIAEIPDYAEARRLLSRMFDTIATEGLTDAIRQTVNAVPETGEVSLTALAKTLELSKSTVSWRVGRALSGGWLKNLETRPGRPFRLQHGDPMPEPACALPKPEEVEEAFESKPFEHSKTGIRTPLNPLGE